MSRVVLDLSGQVVVSLDENTACVLVVWTQFGVSVAMKKSPLVAGSEYPVVASV